MSRKALWYRFIVSRNVLLLQDAASSGLQNVEDTSRDVTSQVSTSLKRVTFQKMKVLLKLVCLRAECLEYMGKAGSKKWLEKIV
jgi:hypothetical protein